MVKVDPRIAELGMSASNADPSSLPLTQAERQKIVDNALGTLRVENLSPSESLQAGLEAYVNGQKTTTDLLNDIKSRYVTPRRN
jgi:hypothetical protein